MPNKIKNWKTLNSMNKEVKLKKYIKFKMKIQF